MRPRFFVSLILLIVTLHPVAPSLFALETEKSLAGRIEGKAYVSPTGIFRIEIPVLPELGGFINDTEAVVTFQDDFNTHCSIACFKMDSSQRWEQETRGRKDYLVWFFANFIQADFEQRFPGSQIESAKFIPAMQDGSLLIYNLLPGGSMFSRKTILTSNNENPPIAKRGNLLFVRADHIFVLSIELAEKILERSSYKKTVAEEDEILRKKLTDLLAKITFTPPADKKPPADAPAS